MSSPAVMSLGIGSLPHHDVDLALDLIFRFFPQIPFWPQLPKRSAREGMVVQFSENLPYLRLKHDKLLFDPAYNEKELESFYEKVIAADSRYFSISKEFAPGLYRFCERLKKADLSKIEFLKCHVTGPFTFAAAVNDERGASLLHDKIFFQAAVKALSLKALWQVELLRQFKKKIILFFDEPYLACFGSAYTPIDRQDITSALSELTGALKAKDLLIGVHCCGNTDWSMLAEIETVDMLSFDAFDFQERFILYSESLKAFLNRGGRICWGIVPASREAEGQTPAVLADKLRKGIDALVKKGISRELLTERLIISPACGLGTLDEASAEGIFKLLSDTASFLS
jgi:methionine synthase II (cobalamin-independent)